MNNGIKNLFAAFCAVFSMYCFREQWIVVGLVSGFTAGIILGYQLDLDKE